MKFYSIIDYIFNRPKKPAPFTTGIFRNVPGRSLPEDIAAQPVKVMNIDGYVLSQSNFTLITANTEYNIQGIATTSAIIIKARGGDVKFSLYEGQSNINYALIPDGHSMEISAIPFGNIAKPVAFYVQSTTAGCVVEMMGMRLL